MENNDDTKLNDETEHHVTAEPLTTSSVDNAQRSTDDLVKFLVLFWYYTIISPFSLHVHKQEKKTLRWS